MNAIELSGVTKVFRIGVGRARVREMIPPPVDAVCERAFPRWWVKDTFRAIDGVSFDVPAGSAIGIVGHNGAGKTTLLKIIAGVTAASEGNTVVRGRLAALLDVLVGFHPELTGRENAYLLGAMLGIGRRAMTPKIDKAIDFAELEQDLIDTPVKRYSAGMTSRLAFGVISAVDTEILLVDEVLSVGDASFQRKCVNWLDEYRARGGTLVFVSHNLGLLRSMAERVLWLDHGQLLDDGSPSEILAHYARASELRRGESRGHRPRDVRKQMQSRGLDRWGAGGARVQEVHMTESVAGTAAIDISVRYGSSALGQGTFCIGFVDETEREIGASASPPVDMKADGGIVQCSFEALPLRPGIYFPVIAILSMDGRVQDRWRLDRALVIEGNGHQPIPREFGPVELASTWAD
jgi:ABC-type polysaccharide/polyol phosphate transport system ATPase subunit